MLSATDTTAVGEIVLGRYRILRRLAKGGMGTIFLARSEGAAGFVRPAIVKCLSPEFSEAKEFRLLFEREARIMSNLHHPSIVAVIDFAASDQQNMMVLEYVHGYHLGQWLRFLGEKKRLMPVDVAIEITLRVLHALDYMHTLTDADGKLLKVLHRDITPSNVLIDVNGHVKLADFGIAHTNADRTQGTSEIIKGKFPYLAPELFEGVPPSVSSDLYSTVLTLHEMLVGSREFSANSDAATIGRVLHHIPSWVDDTRPEVSPGLSRAIAKALHKSPSLRYESVAEFIRVLEELRPAPSDETSRSFRNLVREDFYSDDFARRLDLPALGELEALWSDGAASGSGERPLTATDTAETRAVHARRVKDELTSPEELLASLADDTAPGEPTVPDELTAETVPGELVALPDEIAALLEDRGAPERKGAAEWPAASHGVSPAQGQADAGKPLDALPDPAAYPSLDDRQLDPAQLSKKASSLAGLPKIALAVFVCGALATLAYYQLRTSPAGHTASEKVHYVTEDATDATPLVTAPAPSHADAQVEEHSQQDAGIVATQKRPKPTLRKPAKPKNQAKALMEVFSKRRSKITQCARTHAPKSQGSELSVRISVDTGGGSMART